jgi:hypothetical protein
MTKKRTDADRSPTERPKVDEDFVSLKIAKADSESEVART